MTESLGTEQASQSTHVTCSADTIIYAHQGRRGLTASSASLTPKAQSSPLRTRSRGQAREFPGSPGLRTVVTSRSPVSAYLLSPGVPPPLPAPTLGFSDQAEATDRGHSILERDARASHQKRQAAALHPLTSSPSARTGRHTDAKIHLAEAPPHGHH